MNERYLCMTSSPALSGKAREYGRTYRRMAIVKVAADFPGRPAMISRRARGVLAILADEVHSVGTTPRSYGYRRLREMENEAQALNFKAMYPHTVEEMQATRALNDKT